MVGQIEDPSPETSQHSGIEVYEGGRGVCLVGHLSGQEALSSLRAKEKISSVKFWSLFLLKLIKLEGRVLYVDIYAFKIYCRQGACSFCSLQAGC